MANAGEFPKAQGDIIYRDDYNLVRQSVEDVLSTWWGTSFSAPALVGNPVIGAPGVGLLIDDINKAYTHITGSNSSLPAPSSGLLIDHQLWSDMAVAAQYIETNKNTVGPGQYFDTVGTWTLTKPWNGLYSKQRDYTWPTALDASQFFRTGGKIFVALSSANSDGSQKATDWANNIVAVFPQQTWGYDQWVAGTTITVTEYGNQTQYAENYITVTLTKLNATSLRVSWQINDADTGDQTGLGAAVDENVQLDISVNITHRTSTGAVTGVAPTGGELIDA